MKIAVPQKRENGASCRKLFIYKVWDSLGNWLGIVNRSLTKNALTHSGQVRIICDSLSQ